MKWVRIAVNCIIIIIVIYVFTKVSDERDLVVTIAVLGLLYSSFAIRDDSNYAIQNRRIYEIQAQFVRLRKMLNDPNLETDAESALIEQATTAFRQDLIIRNIDTTFHFVVGLICAAALLDHL